MKQCVTLKFGNLVGNMGFYMKHWEKITLKLTKMVCQTNQNTHKTLNIFSEPPDLTSCPRFARSHWFKLLIWASSIFVTLPLHPLLDPPLISHIWSIANIFLLSAMGHVRGFTVQCGVWPDLTNFHSLDVAAVCLLWHSEILVGCDTVVYYLCHVIW